MNERIRELAEQAKEHANSYDNAGTPIWFQFYNEKLAELIVSECMSQIEEVRLIQTQIDPGPEYIQGFDDGMFVAIRTIEEHFGVKE